MHLWHILTQTMNLQLTHTRKMHRISSTTAPMPQGKYVENKFNQNLKCKAAQQVHEHQTLPYPLCSHTD